jgi:Fe-S cluster assembly iron-binding protein IscA
MISVTKEAKEKLKETLRQHTDTAEESLRMVMKPPGQVGLILDRISPADKFVEHEGTKILILGHEISELLDTAKLDVEDTPDGKKLKIYQD